MPTSNNGALSVKALDVAHTIVSICGDASLAGLTVSQINESGIVATTNNSFGKLFQFQGEPDGLNISFKDALNSTYTAIFNDGVADYPASRTPAFLGVDESTGDYYPVYQ